MKQKKEIAREQDRQKQNKKWKKNRELSFGG